MNGDEPASDLQLHQLGKFGITPDKPLTRREAAQLLFQHEHPQKVLTEHDAFHLRKQVEQAKMQSAPALAAATALRQNFWLDTCRDPVRMQLAWPEIMTLYREHGCRLVTPTHEQAQTILNALDTAMSTWDRDHPALFYQTLELNFPELVQYQVGKSVT